MMFIAVPRARRGRMTDNAFVRTGWHRGERFDRDAVDIAQGPDSANLTFDEQQFISSSSCSLDIFGGAIAGNVQRYLPLMIPGIVAQTVLTTCMSTGVQLREDMEKGVLTASSHCRSRGSPRSLGRWWPTSSVI